jgi:hypothetical protein
MTLEEFRATLALDQAPQGMSSALRALWEDGRGRWSEAHRIAQDIEGQTGAWIHAYLHRKEGDETNAAYWYRRAAQPVARDPLDAEWERLAIHALAIG